MEVPSYKKLIQMYKERPVLWDRRLEAHNKRGAVYRALTEIAEALHLTELDVKRKIHSLRTQYATEKKKLELIKRKLGSNDHVKRSWKYIALDFLDGVISVYPTPSNVLPSNQSSRNQRLAASPKTSPDVSQDLDDTRDYVTPTIYHINEDDTELSVTSQSMSVASDSLLTPKKRSRIENDSESTSSRKTNIMEHSAAQNDLQKQFVQQRSNNRAESDEVHSFLGYLGSLLRPLPTDILMTTEQRILNIVFEARREVRYDETVNVDSETLKALTKLKPDPDADTIASQAVDVDADKGPPLMVKEDCRWDI